ncbi:NAD(P)H-binding protein [Chenggangzhangella methanolivorans]|uniref:NAD(P)H-binding protein n=1 Tax=Chenggangzhangella methanolivorans TaxID=1437009 RepID=A0A9E6R601_9HYPH|nr:NAD(P)H-binding protein [Chenggangzhangella methanolivorans]QZN98855.1 NAD(P)H-binding protein [Chenggangzhangella methanolivorans]
MKTFIVGIAGNVGSRLAAKLAAHGDVVDGLYRRKEQGERLKALGVGATHGDLVAMSAEQLADAVSGSDTLVFSAGAAGEGGAAMTTAIDGEGLTKSIEAARLAGVSRFLLVSAFPEAGRHKQLSETFEHYMAVKKQADMELAESDLDWIILRPGTLTDDPGSGRIRIGPALTYGSVPRDDVAETLAALVHAPRISRRILELTEGETPVADAIVAL